MYMMQFANSNAYYLLASSIANIMYEKNFFYTMKFIFLSFFKSTKVFSHNYIHTYVVCMHW